jgi:protein-tyrosine phosphatase
MKKTLCIAAVLCAAVFLWGCYTEIEPEPPNTRDGLLPIAGAYNVRDIGGYAGADGKKIKYGKLIRSGDLNLLTARDIDYLFGKKLGIKTVVDFRSKQLTVNDDLVVTSEAESAKDRLPEDVDIVWEDTAINESVVVPDYEAVIGSTYADDAAVIEAVKKGYRRIVVGIPGEDPDLGDARAQYKKFFKTLLASDGKPVLFHCSAGKDRTGVAAALLLSALGVSREMIIKDYLASAENVAEKYYPVGPFIEQTVKDMWEAAVILKLPNAESLVEERLAETVKPNVAESVMNKAWAAWKDKPVYQQRRDAAQKIVDKFFEEPLSDQAKGAIKQAVDTYKDRLTPLSQMGEPDAERYAANARKKVQPLLTVKEEYITAAFSAIEEKFITVDAYLTDANGLGLTGADIAKLKELYLEQ